MKLEKCPDCGEKAILYKTELYMGLSAPEEKACEKCIENYKIGSVIYNHYKHLH